MSRFHAKLYQRTAYTSSEFQKQMAASAICQCCHKFVFSWPAQLGAAKAGVAAWPYLESTDFLIQISQRKRHILILNRDFRRDAERAGCETPNGLNAILQKPIADLLGMRSRHSDNPDFHGVVFTKIVEALHGVDGLA